MKTLRYLIPLIILLAALPAHAQTVQCQASNGAWGPCPFVSPVAEAQAVNSKVSAGAGTTITNAFGANTTAGNSILCLAFESAAAIPVITDGQSNTYIVASSSATAPGYTVALASNIVGGTTDTITETTTSGAASFTCHELKGTVAVGQIWDFVNAQQATSASLTFAQQSALLPNEMAFVAVGMNAGTINATPTIASVPSGLTVVDQSNTTPSGGAALAVFYSAHANVTNVPTFTQSISLSASETYSAVLVSVKPIQLPITNGITATNLPTAVDTNTGNAGASTIRVVMATNQPNFTTPLNANEAQINGVTPLMNNGASGTGSQRINIANDNTGIANWGQGATGSAVPSGGQYVGGNGSGNLTGIISCDNSAAINMSTATTTQIVAISGTGGRTYICSIHLVVGAADNVALISGSGSNCASNQAGLAGGTTAASGWNFAANGGLTLGSGLGMVIKTTTTNNEVCLVTSASAQVSGTITYTQF